MQSGVNLNEVVVVGYGKPSQAYRNFKQVKAEVLEQNVTKYFTQQVRRVRVIILLDSQVLMRQ
jgi:hypothetical protein